jgi:hypothetical protein
MSMAYYRRLWAETFRARLRARRWIGCDADWRPAPFLGCECHSCRLVRELSLTAASRSPEQTSQ